MATIIHVEDMASHYISEIKNCLQKSKTEEELRNLKVKKLKSIDGK